MAEQPKSDYTRIRELEAALHVAAEALDDVRGNINPERGYCDELEEEVAAALSTVQAALTDGVQASEDTYYCPECGVMEGNWHMETCSQHKQPRWLVQRANGVQEDSNAQR